MEKSIEEFLNFYRETMGLKEADPSSYSPLVLAYIGDAVYEVMVRIQVINRGNTQVSKLHRHSSQLVCAKGQAEMIHVLEKELTPEETAVFKRGRNAHSATSAKNASIVDYRRATGFEALIGWLFLTRQYERLTFLVSKGFAAAGEIGGNNEKEGTGDQDHEI
ncbi:MAG TPA: ribonuclease III [Candidatus Cottocaccamicrobium excrementipullorum]|nr:ribonuclease III [Candidatus Cottocaccamicrobium excrementipullorum]